MAKAIDLTGRRFGRLTVIERAENQGRWVVWSCECDCGVEKVVRSDNLRTNKTQSCGCLQREQASGRARDRVGPRHPLWSGDDVTYQAQHMRLAKQRGRASEHACVDCGEPAAHWSYRKDCPDEKLQTIRASKSRKPVLAPYCPHIECYEPRCLSCHNVYDKRKEAA